MTDSSLTDITLMIMINVLFISNFLFIHKLRSVVDTFVDNDKNSILNRLQDNAIDSHAIQGLKGFFFGISKSGK